MAELEERDEAKDTAAAEAGAGPSPSEAALAFERLRHEELTGAFSAELDVLRKTLAARLKELRAAMDADMRELARQARSMADPAALPQEDLEDLNRLLLRATEELAAFRVADGSGIEDFVRLSKRLAKLSRSLRKRARRKG